VGGGDDRDAEPFGRFEPGEAHGEFGRHVNHIGLEGSEIVLDVPGAGESPLDIGIQKERDTGRPVYLGAVGGPFRESVVGRVDAQRVAALSSAFTRRSRVTPTPLTIGQ
jgi:hypothetical protein